MFMQDPYSALTLIINAVVQRQSLNQIGDAWRLFNGFYEGLPGLVFDRYGSALVIFNHTQNDNVDEIITEGMRWVLDTIDDLESALLKHRGAPEVWKKNGVLIAGTELPRSVSEYGVDYALDLQLNQDAGFYLDTRNLRRWLHGQLGGKRVLNTFAYTGSLGVAAGAGGAARVVQTDLSEKFLEIAKKSWEINELDPQRCEILPDDFFRVARRLRNENRLFDCVILDPPFFSTTDAGKVDLTRGMTPLINKVRPLVAHEGWLVVINNALYLPGADFMAELAALCESEYLSLAELIPVPPDVTGYPETVVDRPPADPAPFNHPTKIAILRVTRKDKKK